MGIGTKITLTAPSGASIEQGSSVLISGKLTTLQGVGLSNKRVNIFAMGADYDNRAGVAVIYTDSSGNFSYTIPGSYYTALSTDIYDPAVAGAIFFADGTYNDSEKEVHFLVIYSAGCPDGIDASQCVGVSGCNLGDQFCQEGTLYQCAQKKDCTNCYVIAGPCYQPVATVIELYLPEPTPIIQGDSVVIAGYLKTVTGSPVAYKSVRIFAMGADYDNRAGVGDVTTSIQGAFSKTIPGSFYTAISTGAYDPAVAGAIFFGDSAYLTSESEVHFLVKSSTPCPDGIDASECYGISSCELGTTYCENGKLLQCQQKKDCTTCYVNIGPCEMELMPTVLTILSNDYGICMGEPIVISGYLKDDYGNPVSGKTIRLQYGIGDGTTNLSLGTVTTNSSGYFSKNVPASLFTQENVFFFRASFDGSSEYYASTNFIGVIAEDCTPLECTSGTTECVGGVSYQCVNGFWQIGGNACYVPPVCTEGAAKCEGNISYICSNGNWVPGGDVCEVVPADNTIYYVIGGVAVLGAVGAFLLLRK